MAFQQAQSPARQWHAAAEKSRAKQKRMPQFA